MQTFGEQLIAARKAKGMTQEALASAAAVTRQTISSWERGRTLPDVDSVRRLSSILGVELMQADERQIAAVEAVPEVEGQTAPAAAGKRQIKKWWIAAGAAVLACIVIACFLLFPHKNTPKIDIAYYTQETPNEAGKAYLTFSHRTWIENNGDSDYQMYGFTLTEKNGIGFSISRIEVEMDGVNGPSRSMTVTEEDLVQVIDPDIPPYGSVTIDGGFPKGEFVRIGVVVYGQDTNGEPQAFYHLIET